MSRSRSPFPTRLYRPHPWNRTAYTDIHGWRKCKKIIGKYSVSSTINPALLYHLHPYRRTHAPYLHPCKQIMINLKLIIMKKKPQQSITDFCICIRSRGLRADPLLSFNFKFPHLPLARQALFIPS